MDKQTKRPISCGAEELLTLYYPVLDHGFVGLVDYMGDDVSIEQMARVSYGGGNRKTNKTRDLIRYLMRHSHTSPFEGVEIKLHCAMPIVVARQWVRTRTASLNEVSGRYSQLPCVFYMPEDSQFLSQSKANKQGRSEQLLAKNVIKETKLEWDNRRNLIASHYRHMCAEDFSRELARLDLPLSTYTQWYWKIDLHNLMRFLLLRISSHAQWEIQQYAQVIAAMVKKAWPITFEAWEDYQLNSRSFSTQEMEALIRKITGKPNSILLDSTAEDELTDREKMELTSKIFNYQKQEIKDLPEALTTEQAHERFHGKVETNDHKNQ